MLALLWAHELGHIFIAMGKRADLGERQIERDSPIMSYQ